LNQWFKGIHVSMNIEKVMIQSLFVSRSGIF